jgi:RNA polymerase sigma factor (sigma-70 family)
MERGPGRFLLTPARGVAFAGSGAYGGRWVRCMSSVLDTFSSELEGLLARFAGLVRRVGRQHRLSEADLDDVLQEVRIRLWRVHSGGGGRTSEQIEQVSASYVYRTAVSAAIDLLRRRRARGAEQTVALDEVEEPVSEREDPTRSVEEAQLAAQLSRAIEAITPAERDSVHRLSRLQVRWPRAAVVR